MKVTFFRAATVPSPRGDLRVVYYAQPVAAVHELSSTGTKAVLAARDLAAQNHPGELLYLSFDGERKLACYRNVFTK